MLNKHVRISGPCSPFPLAEGSGMSQQKFNLARFEAALTRQWQHLGLACASEIARQQ
ncbi:hypothetical protein [Erwinia tracheiphila]|uniref:hypothetical protein n=1 Tax=Erwinia tracheiphila TaxID=65700 RepID=UPI00039A7873|nr:hypothetical protein [Erwinia tracheiphila]